MWAVADGEKRDDNKMMRFTAYKAKSQIPNLESSILSLISTSTMSAPAPGQYHIYNTVAGQFGEKLAATFHGIDQTLIVDTFNTNNNQQLVCSPPCLLSLCLFSCS